MTTLYQMLSQAVESEDPNVMRAKIQDFEKTFEQKYRRKMTDDELSMLETAKEIVERELWVEKLSKKAA
jgi:soluble cytochrome b562